MRSFSLSLPLAWHHIRQARGAVSEALSDHPKPVRDAAIMAASELLENAVKYGELVDGAPDVSFQLKVEDGSMTMVVSNGSRCAAGVADLHQRIDEIARAPDREALYTRRLEQLLDDSTETGKLGLYRVGFEGGFDLDCTWIEGIVTVTATRRFR